MTFTDLFSDLAADYAKRRPTYPAALFDWLESQCVGRSLAWDVGTGNGQCALGLSGRFARVIATDPSAEQIAAAFTAPGVEYRVAPAEASGLEPGCVDCVTVATALHWFDQDRFHAEIRRVAKPGALVAAWTYFLGRTDPAVDAVEERLYREILGPYWRPEVQHIENGYRSLPFPFEPVPAPEFVVENAWTASDHLAYMRVWSAVGAYKQTRGVDPVDLIEAEFLAAWDDPDKVRIVRRPLSLLAGRV